MHVLELRKPDGRLLTLYGNEPVAGVAAAPSPRDAPLFANPHLRWHPLRGEWVAYASHRQDRTFLPPPEYNPLRPTHTPDAPTELPTGRYDVAVFDNLFPTLAHTAGDAPVLHVPTLPAKGRCEVVVFSQEPSATLGTLPLEHLVLVLRVLGDRTQKLFNEPAIRYVLPFENRGAEIGVTLHHPHGQIYAYPMVPPVPARMLEQEAHFFQQSGGSLLGSLLAQEIESGTRIIYAGEHAIAFVPAWARFPYEAWIAPRTAHAFLFEIEDPVRLDLARALKTVLLKFDGLWQRPMPYVMAWYQAPSDGEPHPECHLHAELLPAYRARDKLKYLAGTELAAGMFANDVLPEEAARRLREVATARVDG